MRLVNRLSDRDILEIDGAKGEVQTTFLGIPNRRIAVATDAKVVDWSNPVDGMTYLRGWRQPNGSSMTEFVYPKEVAVAIAKANPARVPAIDPASEGRVADPTLSRSDMKLITLWLLSTTTVGADQGAPAIKAERYETASNSVPQPPPVKQLPHTASEMPWLWIAGFSSLTLAAALRLRRVGAKRRPARIWMTR